MTYDHAVRVDVLLGPRSWPVRMFEIGVIEHKILGFKPPCTSCKMVSKAGFVPVRLRPPFDPLEVGLVDDSDPDRADKVGAEHRSHHLVRKVGDLADLGILGSMKFIIIM